MEEAIQQSDKTGNMKGGRAWAVVFVVFMAGFCMPANMGETMWVAPLVMQAYGFGPDVLVGSTACSTSWERSSRFRRHRSCVVWEFVGR